MFIQPFFMLKKLNNLSKFRFFLFHKILIINDLQFLMLNSQFLIPSYFVTPSVFFSFAMNF